MDLRIAVKYDAVEIADSRVAGHDSAATLVRRILRVFPGSAVIGAGPRRCDGFDLLPLEFCDPASTLVVNMDVLDSLEVWRTLRRSAGPDAPDPHVMNFLWWPPSTLQHAVDRAALALSCALVPTFADSERTAHEVSEVVARWTVAPLAERARIGWVNLGFRLDHVQPRADAGGAPVVLYPATSLSERKRPDLFLDVVERVHEQVPIRVEARLVESHLIRDLALRMSRRSWMWVGPLTATREDYWGALARTTAFLATASEESYGMEYVEALAAGAVGVFPDLPWVHALLPAGYPLLYRTRDEAVALLRRAVTEADVCRREVDLAVGGSLSAVLRTEHSDAVFDRALRARVTEWFGSPARV
ncbi:MULTISPECIES: glycosyltransferase family 1 protein [Miniimonas]|uniref:glycosyltransferase family 1 protein n=1 Tax=Miniimonas TaxID=947525 RepID=UPI001900E268|nr:MULTISPECIES: glycosyltransferase family 1 protein [Miniimonas]